MEWLDTDRIFQRTAEGSATVHPYFYVYRVAQSYWVAGRYWFNREIDYRVRFEAAEDARDYCEMKERETLVVTAIEA